MNVQRRQALGDARTSLSRALGVRDEAATRLLLLGTEVSQAKGLLVLRPDIEDTLEEFQEAVHRRTVGSYESLLTSLVDEIIGDGSKVCLELSSERGSPCLDLLVEKGGHRFDIMEGQGGALTNVVSMGLRLIATLRSGARPFLVLDEADCWVEGWRIPGFYRVLAQLSGKMGLQVLAITHHPPALLDEATPRVFVVEGEPSSPEGVSAGITRRGAEWKDETHRGIRRIILKDFAGYSDCCFDLAPGLNIISGANNVGKSRVPRALRAACYGEGSLQDIKAGRDAAMVRIEVEDGSSVEWTRETRRNPVTLWRKLAPDMSVLASHGGRSPPEWVGETCGIARRGGLDVQLGHQKIPVFLLGDTASQRASVLSIGRESGLLQAMMRLQKADVEAASSVVRRGEREVSVLDERLRSMCGLDQAGHALNEAAAAITALEQSEVIRVRLRELAASIETKRAGLRRALARAQAVSTTVMGEPPSLQDARPLMAFLSKLETSGERLARASACDTALQGMPDPATLPALLRDAPIRVYAARLHAARKGLGVARLRSAAVEGVEEPNTTSDKTRVARHGLFRFLEITSARDKASSSLVDANRLLAEAEAEWNSHMAGTPCPSCGSAVLSIGSPGAGAHVHGS